MLAFLATILPWHEYPRSIGKAMKGREFGGFRRFGVEDFRITVKIEIGRLLILVVEIGGGMFYVRTTCLRHAAPLYLHIQMIQADGLLDGCMYFTAARLHRALDRLAGGCFGAVDLAPNQAFLLMTVQDRPGTSAGELAKFLHLAPSTVTRFLDKLETRGLVRRRKEGRSAEVKVTAKGAKLRPALDSGWAELYRRYCAILGEKEARALTISMVMAGTAIEAAD